MAPFNWVFVLGMLFIFTGLATMFGRKAVAHASAFCTVMGLIIVGLWPVIYEFSVVSVMECFLCFALALTIIITGAVQEHRRYQSAKKQQEERDGVQEFHA